MAEIGHIDFGDGTTRYLKDRDLSCALGAAEGAGKNLLKNMASSTTIDGVTFTVNSDGSVTADTGSGSATANAGIIVIASGTPEGEAFRSAILGKEVIMSGCPAGGGASKYHLFFWNYDGNGGTKTSYGGDVKFVFSNASANFNISITVFSGTSVSNKTFYPMIRPSGTSPDYVPYMESVGTDVYATKAAVGAEDGCGTNLLLVTGATKTQNGVTYTVNADKSITLSGQASSGTSLAVFSGSIKIPTASKFSIGRIKDASSGCKVTVNGTDYSIPADKPYVNIPSGELTYCEILTNQNFNLPNGITYYPMVYPAYLDEPPFVKYSPSIQMQIDNINGYSSTGANSSMDNARKALELDYPVVMKLEFLASDGTCYGVGIASRADASATPVLNMLATTGLTFVKNQYGTVVAQYNNAGVNGTYRYSKI